MVQTKVAHPIKTLPAFIPAIYMLSLTGVNGISLTLATTQYVIRPKNDEKL